MRRNQRTWVYTPPKPARPKVPDPVKVGIQQRADALIEQTLTPRYIEPVPEEPRFNYITRLYTKWYRNWFYFCAEYASPGPYALSPMFEAKFARMEYVGLDSFHLAFLRHTGEWIELAQGITEEECFRMISAGGHFHP
jgi:hypothetical protein